LSNVDYYPVKYGKIQSVTAFDKSSSECGSGFGLSLLVFGSLIIVVLAGRTSKAASEDRSK
jgi:hypothetical protein